MNHKTAVVCAHILLTFDIDLRPSGTFSDGLLCVFLFVFLRAGRLDDHTDAAGFRGGFHTGFSAAVDGVNLGFGVVRDDRTFGHIAAALYFGIAGQGNEVGCGRIRHGIGLAVDHAFAAVQLFG